MKKIDAILKIILTLIMVMPIMGTLGIFPAPTADLYKTPEAFAFIQALMESGYLLHIMAALFAAAIVMLWTSRTALANIIILPITVNIAAFHLFLDGGLFAMGALMGNILLAMNIYFLWRTRTQYASLFEKRA